MRSDRDHSGKSPRRNPSVPVPGMPYRLHSEHEDPSSAATGRREFEFIESNPVSARQDGAAEAYNPWEELGWQGGETPFPAAREPEVLQEERYFKPMLDLNRELPEAYEETDPYRSAGPYPEFAPEEPAYSAYPDDPDEQFSPPPPPPPPEPPKRERRFEPWRAAVIISCLAGLIFCGVEAYRIAKDVVQSEAALREYREQYLTENNEDFMKNAQAVALLPPGETYPPTASPAPVVTPSPTPRIAVEDPLVAAMAKGIDPNRSVAPGEATPALRSRLERYPDNPLLILRDETTALQAQNADIVGRLIIDGLLSEIVVQRNNTYYLNHNSMGSYSGYGAVFADENLAFRYPPENILLFGRTSNEGKVFAPLKGYLSGGIDFAARYAFLSFNSMYEEARYVIIAVIKSSTDITSPDYFDYQRLSFATDEEFLAFAAGAIGRSAYIFNVGVLPTDRLLTLVTVSDGADLDRIVIVCRMLREGESDGYIQPAN